MSIVLVGLNYQTASLDRREQFYLTQENLQHTLTELHKQGLTEVVIVSTCNRLEIYASTTHEDQAIQTLTTYFMNQDSRFIDRVETGLQTMVNADAVNHLMRVTCGLESLALGETEILGQVADSLKHAEEVGTAGAVLSRMFQAAIHAGKRARTETAISQYTLSISHAAVLKAKHELPDSAPIKALVLGAGRMAELAVKALKGHDAATIWVVNRTYDKARALANYTGSHALEWSQQAIALREAHVIIAATSAPQPILNGVDIERVRGNYPSRRLVVVDIAVPRNVNPNVRQLPYVSLYDIDDLRAVVDENRLKRQVEVSEVEKIIYAEKADYLDWMDSRSTVSTIVALRQKVETLAAEELERTFQRLPYLNEHERAVVEQMAHRIVNKVLHEPTTTLRKRASGGDEFRYLKSVQELFDLEPQVKQE